jgi:hypothetical protein
VAGRRQAHNGLDGVFAFYDNLAINTYWARSESPGVTSGRDSYRAQLDYAGDRYGLQVERLAVGDRFDPGIGFVRRDDMRRSTVQSRFSPRPRGSAVVRKYYFTGGIDYVEDTHGRLETRDRTAGFETEFQNADRGKGTYELIRFLPVPFRIAPGVTLPVGEHLRQHSRRIHRRPAAPLVGRGLRRAGTFYNGHKTSAGVNAGRVMVTPRLSIEPNYAVNWIDLLQGSFTTQLAGARATFTPTPLMFLSAFLQYNSSSHSASTNIRFRWEYRPGSEFFVVFNEDRDTLTPHFPP